MKLYYKEAACHGEQQISGSCLTIHQCPPSLIVISTLGVRKRSRPEGLVILVLITVEMKLLSALRRCPNHARVHGTIRLRVTSPMDATVLATLPLILLVLASSRPGTHSDRAHNNLHILRCFIWPLCP